MVEGKAKKNKSQEGSSKSNDINTSAFGKAGGGKMSCQPIQHASVGGLEKVFFKYGQFVARHPIPVIIGKLVFQTLTAPKS